MFGTQYKECDQRKKVTEDRFSHMGSQLKASPQHDVGLPGDAFEVLASFLDSEDGHNLRQALGSLNN